MKIETKKMKQRFAITVDYDIILSKCSGGKDSLVTSFLASQLITPEKMYIVYNYSPWDFPRTRELVEKFCDEHGLNLIVTTPDVDINQYCVSHGPPNMKYRWCTGKIKTEPTEKAIAEFPNKKILFLDGSRREESHWRRDLPLFEEKKFNGRDVLHPIFDWSEKRVWTLIKSFCLPIHPVYRWSTRLNCFCCPLQSDTAWLSLKKYHPELFNKALNLEEKCGKPFMFKHRFLKNLEAPRIKVSSKTPKRLTLRKYIRPRPIQESFPCDYESWR